MSILLVFAALLMGMARAINLKELTEKVEYLQKTPFVVLTLIYDSEKSGNLEAYLDQLRKSKEGYFEVNSIDCANLDQEATNNFMYCTEKYRPSLPLLTFSDPPLNFIDPETKQRRQVKQIPFQGKLDEKSLLDFATPLIKAYSRHLKTVDDLNSFVADNAQVKRIIFLTEKDSLGIYFKALTTNFRNKFAFAHIYSNSSICQFLKVDKFPTMLLNQKDNLEIRRNLKDQITWLKTIQPEEDANIVIPQIGPSNFLAVEDLEEKVYKNQAYVLVHLCQGKQHPQWKTVQNKYQSMFQYYEGKQEVAKALGVKNLPSIVYFPKSLVKKQVQKTTLHEQLTFEQIHEQISHMLDDFSISVSDDIEMQKLTSIALREQKLASILFHKNDASVFYRVLSNMEKYKQDIIFYKFKDPDAEVMKRYHITKLPTLLVMTKDNSQTEEKSEEKELPEGKESMKLRISIFTGRFQFNEMKMYFDGLTRKPDEDTQQHTTQKEVMHLKNQRHFKNFCEMDSCYLLLLDNNPQKKESTQAQLQLLKSMTRYASAHVTWLDAVCHSELLSTLDIQEDDLPVMLHVRGKGNRYSRLVGRLSDQSLKQFVAKVRAGRVSERPLGDIVMSNKECDKEHQRLKEMRSTQSTLTDQQRQALEEIRMEEERKREEAMKEAEKVSGEGKKKKKRRRKVVQDEDSQL